MCRLLRSARRLLSAVLVTVPCLWDSDTLDDELRGLPEAFDLVVGRWHRHSAFYYQARVARIQALPAPGPADLDDLAVAFEHLGERDAAIATMARKQALLAGAPDPEQQYRYHANLGTFLAHAGRLDEALVELRAAVALNPAAHFGRERFQIDLVEYAIAARKDPAVRQRSFLQWADYELPRWLQFQSGRADLEARPDRELDVDEAMTAVAGMLRFGGREGAELYRSLAVLYEAQGHLHLAWWALQRAIERGHGAAELLQEQARGIERHWREANQHNRKATPIPDLAGFRAQRASADRWVAAFQQAEGEALARGEDVTGDAGLQALLALADAAEPRPVVYGWWVGCGRWWRRGGGG